MRVSTKWIGIIIGIHPVGGFIFGLFVAKFMSQIGRKKMMIASTTITVITLVALGCLCYLRSN